MRSAVDEILAFNRSFDRPSLAIKLVKMSSSAFVFFRGTYHLFMRDIIDGPYRKWPVARASGSIVGDLHSENFGTFRATNGLIVYDVNDFDETTSAPYEYDLRRMMTALLLAGLENAHTLGEAMDSSEIYARAYLAGLTHYGKLKTREDFAKLKETKQVHSVLALAAERSRASFMQYLAAEQEPGVFRFLPSEHFAPVSAATRKQVLARLPGFLKTCAAPPKSDPTTYHLHDVVFRFAGCGSLGRHRYALLLGKSNKAPDTFETLRLVEWKDSLNSAVKARRPISSKGRAADVIRRTAAFQLFEKRYLGSVGMDGRSLQAREIGANDNRFQHREFAELERFRAAARVFGDITARDHLLASLGKPGPRALLKEIHGKEDRFVHKLLSFAVNYTDRTMDDYEEFLDRRAEIAKAWKA